ISRAAGAIAAASFEASGQQCISAQRAIVHEDIYEEFTSELVKASNSLAVGDPEELDTDLGPVVHDQAAERIRRLIDDAVQRGAAVVIDGRNQSEGDEKWIGPTVLEDIPTDARLMVEEVFGPVLTLHKVESVGSAIKLANTTSGLLQASCFVNDLNH